MLPCRPPGPGPTGPSVPSWHGSLPPYGIRWRLVAVPGRPETASSALGGRRRQS